MNSTETAGWFDCAGDRLLGVLSLPSGPSQCTGVVIVVGGPQYRAGSHRQFVSLARRLAESGHPCLRFDIRGMGDSEGEQRSFDALDLDIQAAINHLLAHSSAVQRVVLCGLCDGASAALLYVERTGDSRVAGLALLNPWVRSAASLARAQVKHYYLDRLKQADFWRKLLSGGVAGTALRGLLVNLTTASRPVASPKLSFQHRMAAGWAEFRRPILLLTSELDITAQEFLGLSSTDTNWQFALRINPPRHVALEGADHTCSMPRSKTLVENAMLEWLQTLPAPGQPPC